MIKTNTAYMGLLLAFAMMLSYIESLIPFFFGLPGMKLGLANLAVVLSLYLFGWKEALTINSMRVLLTSFLFGSMSTLLYSAAGAAASFAAMILLRKTNKFSETGVSMAGGVFHNIGQLTAAFFVVRTMGIFYYFPVLLVSGLVTGFLIGVTARAVCPLLAAPAHGKGKRGD